MARSTAGVIHDRAQRVHMHIKAAGAVAPRVPVRSKADHFERDGAEQRQNTWQNRDLRPILPLEPTGLDGTHPQPPALPVDLHGSALGAAGSRPCASSRAGPAGKWADRLKTWAGVLPNRWELNDDTPGPQTTEGVLVFPQRARAVRACWALRASTRDANARAGCRFHNRTRKGNENGRYLDRAFSANTGS